MNTKGSVFILVLVLTAAQAIPLVLKESSPSGEAIVAISSSDPDVNKYINIAYPNHVMHESQSQENPVIGRSFSIVTPGGAAAGTGRGFVSTSALNPYLMPLFLGPINFEGIGLSNFGALNDWVKGIDGIYDSGFGGNGEIRTASAINDNGHVYGNVKTITFDNRAKNKN
ncbi:unnamed protein product [Diatraea saccharalis]|uniref:Uncharacterized protein n=1 Tax=Diatraea saccharalis TaxID=40085 RepID=A0A9N9WIS4_9NEOP|nr:unnamed protein product [Diatraea saccharalis]